MSLAVLGVLAAVLTRPGSNSGIAQVTVGKTDVLDCQWLQQLHTYRLLSGAFPS